MVKYKVQRPPLYSLLNNLCNVVHSVLVNGIHWFQCVLCQNRPQVPSVAYNVALCLFVLECRQPISLTDCLIVPILDILSLFLLLVQLDCEGVPQVKPFGFECLLHTVGRSASRSCSLLHRYRLVGVAVNSLDTGKGIHGFIATLFTQSYSPIITWIPSTCNLIACIHPRVNGVVSGYAH